jgi:WD40 repeat protein
VCSSGAGSAVAAGDKGWRHTALASLSAWQRHYTGVRAVFSHAGPTSHIAFIPDGKTVLTGSEDQTAGLRDASTGQVLGPPLTHESVVWAVAFSPDGKTVLTASQGKPAGLWDVSELPDNP